MFAFLRTVCVASLIGLNTLLHVPALLPLALLKLLAPRACRTGLSHALAAIAESWIGLNNAMIRAFTPTRIELIGHFRPDRQGRFLMLCNHQSWCDIPVLLYRFNRRIPLPRFFLKHPLIWVPALGLAWWALDFPFMQRHSRAELERNPTLRGRDLEATRRACARFAHMPVTIMNFAEGTRFSVAKHAAQSSPYRHLLRPRAGGSAAVLDAMAGRLHAVLDITVIYRDAKPSLAGLMAGRLHHVEVHVHERPIPPELAHGGDYQNDLHYRQHCQDWINTLWAEKDALISARLQMSAADCTLRIQP